MKECEHCKYWDGIFLMGCTKGKLFSNTCFEQVQTSLDDEVVDIWESQYDD